MTDREQRTLQDKFMLRLPDGMRDRIRAAAEAGGRSMNAEIVKTLEAAYPRNATIDALASEIVEKVEAFQRETDAARRAAIMEEIEDLNRVLKYELSQMMEGPPTSDDEDYIKHL